MIWKHYVKNVIKMNRTAINKKANEKLHKMFWDLGISWCEIGLIGCLNTWMLSYAHRHNRIWYYDKPDELLWSRKQVLLGCQHCHDIIDNKMSKEDKEKIFLNLLGKEQ